MRTLQYLSRLKQMKWSHRSHNWGKVWLSHVPLDSKPLHIENIGHDKEGTLVQQCIKIFIDFKLQSLRNVKVAFPFVITK